MTEPTVTKKTSSWMIALKEYNTQSGNGKFVVPKKGSEEYSKVVDIMNKYKTDNNIVTKPRVKKVKPELVIDTNIPPNEVEPIKKGKTVRKKKVIVETKQSNDLEGMSKEELIRELLSKL